MKSKLITAISLCLLTACTSTERYTNANYAPTATSQVEVVDLHQIQHKYTIIGEVQGLSVSTNTMRQKAAALGADAISIPVMNQQGVMISQAIKYKD